MKFFVFLLFTCATIACSNSKRIVENLRWEETSVSHFIDERDGYKGISLLYLSSVFWLDMNAKGYKKTLSVLNYSLENSKPIKVGLKKVNDKIEIVAAKKINTK